MLWQHIFYLVAAVNRVKRWGSLRHPSQQDLQLTSIQRRCADDVVSTSFAWWTLIKYRGLIQHTVVIYWRRQQQSHPVTMPCSCPAQCIPADTLCNLYVSYCTNIPVFVKDTACTHCCMYTFLIVYIM